jgi:hypothetical protein
MALIPLTFAVALVLGGLAAPLVTGDSDLWVATAICWLLAVVLVVSDRLAARSRRHQAQSNDRAMGVPPR